MKIKKRRIKKRPVIKLIIIFILFISIFIGIKKIVYLNSDEYKLKEIGYNKKQIVEILKFKKNYKKKIMSIDYNEFLLNLFKEEYLINDNIDRYIDYQKKHTDMSAKKIVATINVGGDYEHYTNIKETNISDDLLMLVNKYNHISDDYKPSDLEDVRDWYAYGNNQIRKEVYDSFLDMFYDAKEEGLTLIITSGYRNYNVQKGLYEEYQEIYGEKEADRVAAKPGYSEHQTGLALDIVTYDVIMEEFEQTEEFKWMQENAHKYGFILRYPKGKESITGYDYESWHYRYVGIETATKIHELDITFDEYYTYFIK